MKIPVKILANGEDLELPTHATEGSAGLDLRAAVIESVIIQPMERILIPTGVALAIPFGFEGQIRPRSGLAYKNGITVLNSPGTVDSDYRGELKVLLINLSNNSFTIDRGMRIAQLVIHKYEKISLRKSDDIDDTGRSSNGYGSTGIN